MFGFFFGRKWRQLKKPSFFAHCRIIESYYTRSHLSHQKKIVLPFFSRSHVLFRNSVLFCRMLSLPNKENNICHWRDNSTIIDDSNFSWEKRGKNTHTHTENREQPLSIIVILPFILKYMIMFYRSRISTVYVHYEPGRLLVFMSKHLWNSLQTHTHTKKLFRNIRQTAYYSSSHCDQNDYNAR